MSNPKKDPGIDCSKDKIRTKQSFKKETDINTIMARYVKTGSIAPEALAQRQAVFADVSEIGDFQECQERIASAQSAFMTLTPEIRARFENDPAQLLDFVADGENREEAIELGIIPKPEQVAPKVKPEATEKAETPPPKRAPTPPPPSAEGGVPVSGKNK